MRQILCLIAVLLMLSSCKPSSKVAGKVAGEMVEGFARGLGESIGHSSGGAIIKPPEPQNASKREILWQAANQLNQALPIKIDESTILSDVGVQDNGLVYNYELIHWSSTEINSSLATNVIRSTIKERVCTNPDMKSDLQNGYSFYYAYFGNDKKMITKFAINAASCSLKANAKQSRN